MMLVRVIVLVLLCLLATTCHGTDGNSQPQQQCIWRLFARNSALVANASHRRTTTPSTARRYFLRDAAQRPFVPFVVTNATNRTVLALLTAMQTLVDVRVADNVSFSLWGGFTASPPRCTATADGWMSTGNTTLAPSGCLHSNEEGVVRLFGAVTHDALSFAVGPCLSTSPLVGTTGDRADGVLALHDEDGAGGNGGSNASFVTQPVVQLVTVGPPSSLAAMASCNASLYTQAFRWVRNVSSGDAEAEDAVHAVSPAVGEGHVGTSAAAPFTLRSAASSDLNATEALMCTITDLTSYDMRAVPAGTPWLDVATGYCYVFATVSQLHHACTADALCIGYTTNFLGANGAPISSEGGATSSLANATANAKNNGSWCPLEVPLCKLYAGRNASSDVFASFQRMAYFKPDDAARTCAMPLSVAAASTQASNSTTLSLEVWVSMGAMRNGYVDVFVDNGLATRCGGGEADRFESGAFGVDGDCDALSLCVSLVQNGSSTPNATTKNVSVLYVAAAGAPTNFGCRSALTVIVKAVDRNAASATATAPTVFPAAIPEAAMTPYRAASLATYDRVESQWISMATTATTVFVADAHAITVSVQQTAFGVEASADRFVEWSVLSHVRRCGGGGTASGFAGNQSGLSNHCKVFFACGDVVNAADGALSTAFTGFVEIRVSAALLTASKRACGGLLLNVTALRHSSTNSSGTSAQATAAAAFGFPLGSATAAYRPLLGLSGNASSLSLTETTLAQYFDWEQVPTAERALLAAGFDATSILSSVDTATASNTSWVTAPWDAAETRLAWLHPNASYGVFMDTLQDSGTSFFYVPTAATHMSVQVTQSLLRPTASVAVLVWIGYEIVEVLRCVQAEDLIHHPDSCRFVTCAATQLPQGADSITVLVDGDGAGSNARCAFAVATVLVFSQQPVNRSLVASVSDTAPSDPEASCVLRCPATQSCLSRAMLCDGVDHCIGGYDETPCRDWFHVEDGRVLPAVVEGSSSPSTVLVHPLNATASGNATATAVVVLSGGRPVRDCILEAMIRGANAIAFNATLCVVYTTPPAAVATPDGALIEDASLSLYLSLPRVGGRTLQTTTYGRCSEPYTCNGRGVLVNGSTGGMVDGSGAGCSCICNTSLGFRGDRCDVPNADVDAPEVFVLRLPVGGESGDSVSASLTALSLAMSTAIPTVASEGSASCMVFGWVSAAAGGTPGVTDAVWFVCSIAKSGRSAAMPSPLRRQHLDTVVANLTTALSNPVAPILLGVEAPASVPLAARVGPLAARVGPLTMTAAPSSRCTLVQAAPTTIRGVCDIGAAVAAIAPTDRTAFVRIAITADAPFERANVTVYNASSGATLHGHRCRLVTERSAPGGCHESVCLVPVTPTGGSASTTTWLSMQATLAVVFEASPGAVTTPISEQVCALLTPLRVDVYHGPTLPAVVAVGSGNATFDNSSSTGGGVGLEVAPSSVRVPLLATGFAILGIGCVLGAMGIALLLSDARDAERLAAEADAEEATAVTKVLHEGFARLQWYVRTPHRFRKAHWGLVGAVVGYNTVVVGVVAVLVGFLFPAEANYLVALESYTDLACDASPTSWLPLTQALIDPAESCATSGMRVGKGGFGRVAVGARCFEEAGTLWAAVYYAASEGECASSRRDDAPMLLVRNGTCLPSPGFMEYAYMLVVCGLVPDVQARHDAFKQMTGARVPSLVAASVSVRSPPQDALMLNATYAAKANAVGVTVVSFVKRFATKASSSHSEELLESTAAPQLVVQDEDGVPTSRLVFQTTGSFDATPSPAAQRTALDVANIATPLDALATTGPLVSAYTAPSTVGDVPVGFLYNRFNRSSADGGSLLDGSGVFDRREVLARAHRYYRQRGSIADVGYYYGPESTDDGLGFTISFYARFEATTEGFVFASMDALEEFDSTGNTLGSPLLDALWTMEAQLLHGGEWFESPFRVYYALYVSALTRRFHFVMADPVREKESIVDLAGNNSRYVRAVWDIDSIVGFDGQAMFNLEWHHIAIVMHNENNNAKVRLVVDGFSPYKDGARCVPRQPTPIAAWTDGLTMPSISPRTASAYRDGVLYVGLLEGGVAALRFEPEAIATLALTTRGTKAARSLHDLHREKIYGIAVVLILFATVLALLTVCSSGYAVSVESQEVDESDVTSSVEAFVRITRHAVTGPASQPSEATRQTRQPKAYPRVSFNTAKRWLDLSQSQIVLFLDELQQVSKYPHRELVRILYLIRVAHRDKTRPNTEARVPTYTEWCGLIDHDLRCPKQPKRQFFWEPRHKEGDPVEDVLHPLEHASLLQDFPTEEQRVQQQDEDHSNVRGTSSDLGQDAAEANARTAGAGYVDIGGGAGKARDGIGGIGGTRSSAGAGTSSSSSDVTGRLYQFLLPVITSLQTVYVWMSSLSFPGDYDETFGTFFSAIAIDIASVVQALSAYSTPLMQLLIGLVVVGALYYLCAVDNKRFEWYVCRYTLKRDQLEGRVPPTASSERRAGSNVEAESVEATLPQVEQPPKEDTASSPVTADGAPLLPLVKKAATTGIAAANSDGTLVAARPTNNRHPKWQFIPRPLYAYSLVESSFLKAFADPFDDTVSSDVTYDVELLPMTECQRIDRFCRAFSLLPGSDEDPLATAERIEVVDDEGSRVTLSRSACEGCVPIPAADAPPDVQGAEYVEETQKERKQRKRAPLPRQHNPAAELFLMPTALGPNESITSRLEVLGCYCRRHPARRLSPLIQTIVWPFEDPPTCCVVTNGLRCGQRSGLMYSCGVYGKSTAASGAPYCCDYAVCERHYRGDLKDVLLARVVGIVRMVKDRGWSWALAVAFVTIGNAAYTPFMKTALMVLSCHPYFQCVFACWDDPDVVFVVAAFLSIVMLVAFGLGVPVIQVSLLRFRQSRLQTIFLSEEYGGRYAAVEPPVPKLERMGMYEFVFGLFTGNSIRPLLHYLQQHADRTGGILVSSLAQDTDRRGFDRPLESSALAEGKPTPGPAATGVAPSHRKPSPQLQQQAAPTVSIPEWSRFLATDPTAMAMLYNTMELGFMHLSPILLMWKVLMISQVVFLENGSLEQRTGMAVVEVLFAAAIFTTAPFTSPVVDAMYRLASIHQLLLLGLQNMETVRVIDGETSLAYVMLGCSGLYLLVCVWVVAVTSVWPAVVTIRDKHKAQTLLQSLGLQYSGTTTLYVTPVVGRGVRVKERGTFRSVDGIVLAAAADDSAERSVQTQRAKAKAQPSSGSGGGGGRVEGERDDSDEQVPSNPLSM